MLDGFHFRFGYHYRGIIMEALATLVPSLGGPAVALLLVIFMYLKIQAKRKETKIERDQDSQALHDSVLKLQFDVARLKGDLDQQRNIMMT